MMLDIPVWPTTDENVHLSLRFLNDLVNSIQKCTSRGFVAFIKGINDDDCASDASNLDDNLNTFI